ncbi:MerR family transcriptional regulator [Hutsoniella sourekii]|uniref:hypothetical protein n=1 Tax=Hutsoniella sourekii TaxID=87650 RepID=UPI0004846FB7|nr:hypothetical protein [Hutsoniella sourekii]
MKIPITLSEDQSNEIFNQLKSLALEAFDEALSDTEILTKPFVNQKELMELMGVGKGTIDSLIIRYGLRYTQAGRQKIFLMDDVIACLKDSQIKM